LVIRLCDSPAERHQIRYALFVTFFPQLIAGPIVHHGEMIPQFAKTVGQRIDAGLLAMGVSVFMLGLFKKVFIADTLAQFATPVFSAAAAGYPIGIADAWIGALGDAFQLYFDFSGYSEMAMGLALMFGIRLPLNFNSPFKSASIIEFWRRWHMSLSRFLQNYLFLPSSMMEMRHRLASQPYISFFITMFLAGLWHGASWTFVIWGLFHGALIALNIAWRSFKKANGIAQDSWWNRWLLGYPLTLLGVVLSLVIFRADSPGTAIYIFVAMTGLGPDVPLTTGITTWHAGSMIDWLLALGIPVARWSQQWPLLQAEIWLLFAAAIVWVFPNTYQIFGRGEAGIETYPVEPMTGTAAQWLR
jgi:alginate O-acetyltransferase complex protein AlgI